MTDEKVNEQVTVRPGLTGLGMDAETAADVDLSMCRSMLGPETDEEQSLVAEPHLSALPPSAPSIYTLPEKLSLAINDAIGQKPEYSGRYCTLCGETTAHFRPRGKGPDYVKSMQWCCALCFMPGGAVYEIVKSLMIRQGEIAK